MSSVGGALAVRLGQAGYAVRLGAREGKDLGALLQIARLGDPGPAVARASTRA